MVVIFLGKFFYVFWRPVWRIHPKVKSHSRENFFDLVKGLTAKVWRAQHFSFRFLDEVTNVNDVVVLQAICRADRELKLINLA